MVRMVLWSARVTIVLVWGDQTVSEADAGTMLPDLAGLALDHHSHMVFLFTDTARLATIVVNLVRCLLALGLAIALASFRRRRNATGHVESWREGGIEVRVSESEGVKNEVRVEVYE